MDAGIRGSLLRGRNGRPTDAGQGIRKAVLVGGGAVLLALGVAGQFAWPWSGPDIEFDEQARNRLLGHREDDEVRAAGGDEGVEVGIGLDTPGLGNGPGPLGVAHDHA